MMQVAGSSSQALETLYDRYASSVMGVVLRILHNRETAEEVVQETFWRVWDKADSFDVQRGSFSAWLFSIARRYAIDRLRREKIRPQAAVSDAEAEQMQKQANPDDNVADSAWNAILRRQVQAAVTSLPPEQNQIIRMAYFQGMTRQEIAQTTQTPLGTVHTRARLALNKLRKILKAEEIEA